MLYKNKYEKLNLLIVDDDEDEQQFIQEAIKDFSDGINVTYVEDGEDLLDYLYRRGKYSDVKELSGPTLILLDLRMPKKDGLEVLKEIKSDTSLKVVPIVIYTTSKSKEDILQSYNLGASSYVVKPISFNDTEKILKVISQYWLGVVELPFIVYKGEDDGREY